MKIPFNKPHFTGREVFHLSEAAVIGKLSGNGSYTRQCQAFFEKRYDVSKVLLTTSCSDALEMSALLCGIKEGDEVIMPSYTFVSTANAFALRGARIVFADSCPENPNIDPDSVEELITYRTKAIVVVHYGGIACDMERILQIAEKNNLIVIEDAAQGLEASFNGRPLGTIGSFGTFSFHETKNVTSGEGGMICVNVPEKVTEAEIIWEKGTNRAAFARGEVQKYEWVSLGSSFLPNELTAAFLFAQLENIDDIQQKRLNIWNRYFELLNIEELKGKINLPFVPGYARHNGHLFYITVTSEEIREELLKHLHENGIYAVFHYLSLHNSPYYRQLNGNRLLPNAERYSSTLLRLPFFYSLQDDEILYIVDSIRKFFKSR
ncbi:MAG TPA: dTDP-4-amino-4,6-dideoxygalactose transaminase [Lentimicrobium sp.]|nr:dTDP-4-amino-4,6-dideoxygalactose transaminase [Lentimicrobium sp.]